MIGARIRASGPTPETIGRSRVVGEISECLLEPLERLLASGSCMGRQGRRENFQRVTKLLALDAERVNLVVVMQFVVGLREERRDHGLEVPPRIGPKVRPTPPVMDTIQQSVDTAAPIRIHELFKLGADGHPRLAPLFGEHRDQSTACPRRVVRQTIGEHVKVACLTRGASQPAETFFEPGSTFRRDHGVESIECGQGAACGDAQLMNMLCVVGHVTSCSEFSPDGIEAPAERCRRQLPDGEPVVVVHDPSVRGRHQARSARYGTLRGAIAEWALCR